MPFTTQGKANFKYLLIVALVAAVAGGIVFVAWNYYKKEIVNLDKIDNIKISKNLINGECGSAINDYNGPAPYEGTPIPENNLCNKGNPTEVSDNNWANFSWWCKGLNGGDDQYCDTSYPKNGTEAEIIDGSCGSAVNLIFPPKAGNFFYSSFCEHGIPSSITSSTDGNSWKCYGVNGGGKAVSCSMKFPTDQELKNYFKATEIVHFNILDSYNIDFWAESNCPYGGKGYEYQVPKGYGLGYCEAGEKGSHGGCKTCEMSKINLVWGRQSPESLFSEKKNISNKISRQTFSEKDITIERIPIDDIIFSNDEKIKDYFSKEINDINKNYIEIKRIKDLANDNEIIFLSYSTQNCMGGNCLGGNIALYKANDYYWEIDSIGKGIGNIDNGDGYWPLILKKLNDNYLLGTTVIGCCAGCVSISGATILLTVESGKFYYYQLNSSIDLDGSPGYKISSEYLLSNDSKKLTETRSLEYYKEDSLCSYDSDKIITSISESANYKFNDQEKSFSR